MPESVDPRDLLLQTFGPGGESWLVYSPGRVNLIGEHIDYHSLPVFPIAMRRRILAAFRARADNRIRAVSAGPYGVREFEWTPGLEPVGAGDWENYLRAAAETVRRKWGTGRGVDAAVVSDLPPAAGLSSSSALLVAFTLGLLRANNHLAVFEELMEVLPDGEQFVGTRGGGMDHAAVLGSRKGCASLIGFDPLSIRAVPAPNDWAFLVAHSLTTAEKSGAARELYNSRRVAGSVALKRLGYPSYKAVVENHTPEEMEALAAERLPTIEEQDSFRHVTGEALRVGAAVGALERGDAEQFGRLLVASHASLRDKLKISSPALDELVDAALASGATGARLTGGGFGGCTVVFCLKRDLPSVREELIRRFYASRPEFDERAHLIAGEPGPGALYAEA
ncbi:MAG: hypothetical protein KIT09_28470 [Bryobacteraceae bacterium]|nr:hypothetical protein [Bryobacteraceae bacterium]